ncbi:Protein phosphatase 1 regulatory subunit 21 [Trichinella spiralis]|uniref:Protein phosphatase 1 regulatory subunit 21 n=2 Tax=Trichinella TaxID=6333 RepID=A0A0V1AW17_TRISP|nr:Protein phosphatase 1 regulatory subunit 21 [Trichinella spiralis]
MSRLCMAVINEESNETYWDNATCSQLFKMPSQASLIIILTSLVVTIVIGISTTLVNFISCITIFKDIQSDNDNAEVCNIYLTITFMIKGLGVVYTSVATLLSYTRQRNPAISSVECFWQLFPIRLCNCILENIFFVVASHWHTSVFTPTLLTTKISTMLNIMQPICVLVITAFVTYVRSLCVDDYMMPLCHMLSLVITQKQIRSLSQFPALVCFTFLIDLLIVYWIISSRYSNSQSNEQSTTMHTVPPKAKDPFYYIIFGTFGVYCFAVCFGELINNYSPIVDVAESPLWYNSFDVFFHLEGLASNRTSELFEHSLQLTSFNKIQSTFPIASDTVCHLANLLLAFIVHFMHQTVTIYQPFSMQSGHQLWWTKTSDRKGRDQFVSSTPNTGAKSVEEIWGKVKFFTKCQAGTKVKTCSTERTLAAKEVTNSTRIPLTLPLPLFPKLTKAKTMLTPANHEMMQKVPVGYPLQRRLSMTNELNQFVAACPTSEPQAGQIQLARRTSAVSEMSPMRHYKSKSLVNGVQAEWISSEQKYTPFRGGVDCKRNKGSSVDCHSLNLAKQRPHENNQDFGQNGGDQADDGGRTTPNSLAAAWRNSYTLHRSNVDLSGADLNPPASKSTSNNTQTRRLPLSLPQQQAAYPAQFQAPMAAVAYDPSAVPLPYAPTIPPWAAYAYTPTAQQWMMTMPACNGKSPTTTNFEQKIPQATIQPNNTNSAGKPQVKKMLRIISVIHMLLGSTISLLGILRKVFATHMATGVECLVGIYVLIVGIIALSGLKRQNNCLLLASFVMATLQCVFLLFPIFAATQSLNHFAGTALGSPMKETVDILMVVLSVLQLTAAGVFLAYACSLISTPLKQSSHDEEKSTKCEQQQKQQQSADQQTTANGVVSQPQNKTFHNINIIFNVKTKEANTSAFRHDLSNCDIFLIMSTEVAAETLQGNYKRVAEEYMKLRAQVPILKQAVVDGEVKFSEVMQKLHAKDAQIFQLESELSSLKLNNSHLIKRIERLQNEFGNTVPTSGLLKIRASFRQKTNQAKSVTSDAWYLEQRTQVLEEELRCKLVENEQLHRKIHELEDVHEHELYGLSEKLNSIQRQAELYQNELAIVHETRLAATQKSVEQQKSIIVTELKEDGSNLASISSNCSTGEKNGNSKADSENFPTALVEMFNALKDLASAHSDLFTCYESRSRFLAKNCNLSQELVTVCLKGRPICQRLLEVARLKAVEPPLNTNTEDPFRTNNQHSAILNECTADWCNDELRLANENVAERLDQYFDSAQQLLRLIVDDELASNSCFHTAVSLLQRLIQSANLLQQSYSTKVEHEKNLQHLNSTSLGSNVKVLSSLDLIYDASQRMLSVLNSLKTLLVEKQAAVQDSGIEQREFTPAIELNNSRVTDKMALDLLSSDTPFLDSESDQMIFSEMSALRENMLEIQNENVCLKSENELLRTKLMLHSSADKTEICNDYDLIRKSYQSQIDNLLASTHTAESKATYFHRECRNLISTLHALSAQKLALDDTVKAMKGQMAHLMDELETTRLGYEGQLSSLSEHMAQMNLRLTAQADEIEILRRGKKK